MEIKPDVDITIEDVVTQAITIAQLFNEVVRLIVDGVEIEIRPHDMTQTRMSKLQELKARLGDHRVVARSLSEARQAVFEKALRKVCPPLHHIPAR